MGLEAFRNVHGQELTSPDALFIHWLREVGRPAKESTTENLLPTVAEAIGLVSLVLA